MIAKGHRRLANRLPNPRSDGGSALDDKGPATAVVTARGQFPATQKGTTVCGEHNDPFLRGRRDREKFGVSQEPAWSRQVVRHCEKSNL